MAEAVPTPHPARAPLTAEAATTLPDGTRIAVELSGPVVTHAHAERALAAAAAELRQPVAPTTEPGGDAATYCGIVGSSPAMRELFRMLERIRTSHATILISGENGTGKELVARAIHQLSPRAKKAFVATNCSAFNDNLLESELFGHRRGAFTGAVTEKRGLFEIADGGTFFLDEVGDMSPALQVKLLRVLQEGTFMPVGGTEVRKVDVRIIAATNRELPKMVAQGAFREDLFYRLNVVALRVPALRERRSDIPVLIEHFIRRLAGRNGRTTMLSRAALERLIDHDWPGNVRELENEIERLWVLAAGDHVVEPSDLTPAIAQGRPEPRPTPSAAGHVVPTGTTNLPAAVELLERTMIESALTRAGGNKTRAAEELGISRRNLIRKVQAYAIAAPVDRSSTAPGELGDDAEEDGA